MTTRSLLVATTAAFALAAAPASAQNEVEPVGCTLGWAQSPTEQTYHCLGPENVRPIDWEAINNAFCQVQMTVHRLTTPPDDPMPVYCLALPPDGS